LTAEGCSVSAGVTIWPAPGVGASGVPPLFDVLLANEREEITEAGIANVALALSPSEPWHTPPLSCGLVDGVMRRELLRRGQLVEAVVGVEQLLAAAAMRPPGSEAAGAGGEAWFPRIYCFNAVRGIYEVELAPQL
jgi:branched-subunit amino acid aminotransferase/4-amino-4-deoxychorismate lyase